MFVMVQRKYYIKVNIILIIHIAFVISGFVSHASRIKRLSNSLKTFQCRNGESISQFDVCDGEKNCRDGSDETQATCLLHSIPYCQSRSFRCAYGACINGNKKCDGKWDCFDGSDELLLECPNFKWITINGPIPTCKPSEFQCRNGQCISQFSLCDGTTECEDKSDETVTHCNSPSFVCGSSSFRCAYGGCIDGRLKCNNRTVNCVDGSDEDPLLCGYSEPVTIPQRQPIDVSPTQTIPVANSDTCLVPSNPEAFYTAKKCRRNTDCSKLQPLSVVRLYYPLYVNCQDGYIAENDYVVCEGNGMWSAATGCVKLCPALSSPLLKSVCQYNYAEQSCDKPLRPNTTALISCVEGYSSGLSDKSTNHCLKTGEWLYTLPSCKYDCGTVDTSVPLIEDGTDAEISLYPWSTALYKYNSTLNEFNHYCGGTLVTPLVIVTAAHCVYVTEKSRRVQRPLNSLRIGLGKIRRDFYDPSDKHAQILEVASLHVAIGYQGDKTRFSVDVAVLELKEPAKITSYVKPVCFDRFQRNELKENDIGVVTGWGLDRPMSAGGKPTPLLQKASLPYISYYECLKIIGVKKESFLTEDKFCAFFTNGTTTTVHPGDSGSGLVFKIGDLYYLYGIVSTKIAGLYNTFSSIRYKQNFDTILNAIDDIHRKRNFV